MCLCKVVIFLCLLSAAIPAPTTKASYGDFEYSKSVRVRNKQQAKFDCSGTFPKGSKLKWFREKKDNRGVLLEVTDRYWKKQFQAEYQISMSFDAANNYYMSQLTIRTTKQNYAGNYYCKVLNSSGNTLVQSKAISLEITGGNKNCKVPVVTGITGRWDKEKNFTTVSWTVDPPLKSQWCKGNKLLWFIRYCPWDSIDQVPDNLTSVDPNGDAWSAWMYLDKRQRTINMVNMSNENYYLFEVGWRSKHKNVIHYKYASKLIYFGQQVGARIIKAENVRVKAGEKAELSCTVDGMPKPKVIWTVALKDTNPSLGLRGNNNKVKAVSPVTKKVYVTARNQRRYTCIAKNTIVKNGLKTTVIQSATILLTIES